MRDSLQSFSGISDKFSMNVYLERSPTIKHFPTLDKSEASDKKSRSGFAKIVHLPLSTNYTDRPGENLNKTITGRRFITQLTSHTVS